MKAACAHCAHEVEFHYGTAIVKCLMCNTHLTVCSDYDSDISDNMIAVYFWLEHMHPQI